MQMYREGLLQNFNPILNHQLKYNEMRELNCNIYHRGRRLLAHHIIPHQTCTLAIAAAPLTLAIVDTHR